MAKMTGNFDWKVPEVVPAFIQGKDARQVYTDVKALAGEGFGYDAKTRTFYGSNPFVAARVDTKLRDLGIRVADRFDIHRPEVLRMVQGNHYTDTPTLVLRSMQDSYERNLPLIKRVAEMVEEKAGKLELPVMITGFDVVADPRDKEGYGVNIVPRGDFIAIHDERLSGKCHGKKFNEVDDQALPRFSEDGKRTWYARNEGLSGLCLYRNLCVSSNDEYLAYSNSYGRVVLISGEATAKNFTEELRRVHDQRKSELQQWLEESIAKMPGAKE